MRYLNYLFLFSLLFFSSCSLQSAQNHDTKIKTGAEQTEKYIPYIKNKKVAVVANHSSIIGDVHLVDTLLKNQINIIKIFSPEHGFRGDAEAGEFVNSHLDESTGLQVISLYGNSKKPNIRDLQDVDIVIFDMQDVGVRYYTYISTMHYVMEACAETDVEMLILDRPNPNGFYVDGPVLDTNYRSFVGMHPVPIVHGMTIGEFAQMINGEKWLKDNLQCKLKIIPCGNYTHDSLYNLPVNPSPNLQNMLSVYLYPSLGFFEGTSLSVGRGTGFPFQVFGGPDMINVDFEFIPDKPNGTKIEPINWNKKCYGIDLRNIDIKNLIRKKQINLEWLLFAYKNVHNKDKFFNNYFYNIAGNNVLKKQIIEGKTADEIRQSWQEGIKGFKLVRKKYLLYKDFE